MKQQIRTDNAPAAIGVYSQAIKSGRFVYLSGQIGINPSTGEIAESFEKQLRQVMANITALCEASDSALNNIVKLSVFLDDIDDFTKLNEVLAEYLQEPYPARSAMEVSRLPRDAKVEIEATLRLPGSCKN